jgi:hypothetical protein
MGGCVRMNSDDDFPIRQALPVGARFWCWARISIEIIVYYSRYNTFILVTHISMAPERRARVDDLR